MLVARKLCKQIFTYRNVEPQFLEEQAGTLCRQYPNGVNADLLVGKPVAGPIEERVDGDLARLVYRVAQLANGAVDVGFMRL